MYFLSITLQGAQWVTVVVLLLGCAKVWLALRRSLDDRSCARGRAGGALAVWLRWLNYLTFDVHRSAETSSGACVHKRRHTHFFRNRSHFLAEGIFCERVGGWPGLTCQAILASYFDLYVFLLKLFSPSSLRYSFSLRFFFLSSPFLLLLSNILIQ